MRADMESICIDPAGFICFRFGTLNERADWLEDCIPDNVIGDVAFNSDGPPWRLTFNLGKINTGVFELRSRGGRDLNEVSGNRP